MLREMARFPSDSHESRDNCEVVLNCSQEVQNEVTRPNVIEMTHLYKFLLYITHFNSENKEFVQTSSVLGKILSVRKNILRNTKCEILNN